MCRLWEVENCVGLENESPLDVPLWHAEYFELKIIKAQEVQEELLTTA